VADLCRSWKIDFSLTPTYELLQSKQLPAWTRKGYGNPNFILAGFILPLSCSAPCGARKTTIDTGCDPALTHNCVDHPADRNPFQNGNPIKFPIIQPLALKHDRKLRNSMAPDVAWQFATYNVEVVTAIAVFLYR